MVAHKEMVGDADKVKLAMVVPIGPLDRLGYQYVAQHCIKSMCNAADTVYLASTTRENEAGPYPGDGRATIISDVTTWFDLDEKAGEHFDAGLVMDAVNEGALQAQLGGCDAAVCIFVNNYVGLAAGYWLRMEAEQMLADDRGYADYYRRDELAGQAFGTSIRMPYIVNLREPHHYYFGLDRVTEGDQVYTMNRGSWPAYDLTAVVDLQLEMTERDLADKMTYIRSYADLVPKRKTTYDQFYWERYFVDKFLKKRPVKMPSVFATSPEFVSHAILRELR